VSKDLLTKFKEAEDSLSFYEERRSAKELEMTEEMVIWQRPASRPVLSTEQVLKNKIFNVTSIIEKNLDLKIKGKVDGDSWSLKKIGTLTESNFFRNFFNQQKDYCNLAITLTPDTFSFEGYRMIEVTNRYSERVPLDTLGKMKEVFGKSFQMIKKDYGKNEKGLNVIILGFHYRGSDISRTQHKQEARN